MRKSRTFAERQAAVWHVKPDDKNDPPESVALRLTLRQQQQLELMRCEMGYRSRAAMLQSLIATLLRDYAQKD